MHWPISEYQSNPNPDTNPNSNPKPNLTNPNRIFSLFCTNNLPFATRSIQQ